MGRCDSSHYVFIHDTIIVPLNKVVNMMKEVMKCYKCHFSYELIKFVQ